MLKFLILLLFLTMFSRGAAGNVFKQAIDFSKSVVAKQEKRDQEYADKVAEGLHQLVNLSRERAAKSIASQPDYFRTVRDSGLKMFLPAEINPYKTIIEYKGFDTLKVNKLELEMSKAAQRSIAECDPIVKEKTDSLYFPDPVNMATGGLKVNFKASSYFSEVTYDDLLLACAPVVSIALETNDFKVLEGELTAIYDQLAIVDRPVLDLRAHVTKVALRGFFDAIYKQEMKIRENPEATANPEVIFALTPPVDPIISLDYK